MGRFTGVLLASDLDGTLINRQRQLPDANRTALAYFMENGGLFAVSTGRSRLGFEVLRPQIPVNAPCVMGNGALLYDLVNEQVLHEQPLPDDVLPLLAETSDAFPDVAVEIHGRDAMYVWRHNAASQRHFDILQLPFVEVQDLREVPEPRYKCVMTGDPDRLVKLSEFFRERAQNRCLAAFSVPHLYEIFDLNAGKGTALERLADMLGLERRHVYVAGDQQNDWEMFDRFVSFAPSDGDPSTVARADYRVGSCDQGAMAGVVEILGTLYTEESKCQSCP